MDKWILVSLGCLSLVAHAGELPPTDCKVTLAADRNIAVVGGAGVMGKGFSSRLAKAGFKVDIQEHPSAEPAMQRFRDTFLTPGHGLDVVFTTDLEEMVLRLERPRKILFLVPREDIMESILTELKDLLAPGDLIIDARNAHFKDTERRQKEWLERKIFFLGMGVSGGEWGALSGSSMMPGGTREAYELVRPMLEAIAARVPDLDQPNNAKLSTPSVSYIGPGGAGHFVKMVHNGIEYAEMQLLAEAYHLATSVLGYTAKDMSELFARWNEGQLGSFLTATAAKVCKKIDPETGLPLVDLVLDQAEQKGTGKWTLEAALDLGAHTPVIAAALEARFISALKSQRVEFSKLLRGPKPRELSAKEAKRFLESLEHAMLVARLIDYAEGFTIFEYASRDLGYGLNIGEITRGWRAGSILQGKMLDQIHAVYHKLGPAGASKPSELLRYASPYLGSRQQALRETVLMATSQGIATPALSAALGYYDSLRASRGPANLLQALRDYFGAHTYVRSDKPELGHVHSQWD